MKVLAVHLQFVPAVRPPFVTLCLAGFKALEKNRETPQYTSNLYRRYASNFVPAIRLPFRGPFWLDDRGTRQWKWLEEVPCRTSLVPLASPCFVLCLIGWKQKGFYTTRGGRGISSIVRWNLRPVIFGVDHLYRRYLLTLNYYSRKNYSEIVIFGEITNLTRNSLKMSFFPGHFESTKPLKITKNDSQGIIFVIISC